MAMFGFCEMDDCWFLFGVEDVVEIQYGVMRSPCVKFHGVYGRVSIGCGGGFLVRWCWGRVSVCVCWLLGVVRVLSGEEPL